MQKYTDAVQNRMGLAVEGAKVLATDINGSVATIFSNNGTTQQSNPMTTDANGRFSFYAADGRYNLTVTINNVQYGEQRDILLNDPADPSPEKIDGGVIINSQVNNSEVNDCTITGGAAQQVTVTGSTISQSELDDVTINGLPPMTVGGQEYQDLVENYQLLTAQSREALRRSYADAGHNLVDGSFEEGGALTSTDDVMITASGDGYSWGGPEFPHNVAKGTDPTVVNSGYVPRTDGLLRNYLKQYGEASLWLRTRIIAAEGRFGGMIFGDSSLAAANKNSIAIQAALDYAESIGGAIVEIPCGLGYVYYNAAPVIPKDTTLFSKSLWLVKVGNHVNADYSIDALVHTKKYTGDNCSRFGIKGIIFKGNTRSAYGIYGDKTDHSFIEDCFFVNIDRGHRFADAWLCRWTNVTWNNQGYAAGIVAFEGLVGTSNTLTQCWSKDFAGAYDMGQLHYSTLVGCGVDSFSTFAYLHGNNTTLVACGAEDAMLVPGGKVVGCGSRVMTINGLTLLSIGASAGVVAGDGTSLFNFVGTAVTVNGFRCPDLLASAAGKIDLCLTAASVAIEFSPSLLPANLRYYYNYSDAGTSRMTMRFKDGNYVWINNKGNTPNFITDSSLKFSSRGFPMVSSKLFAGSSTLPTAQTFTGQDEAYENSHTVFSGAAGSSVNVLTFTTTAAANRRSSIVMDIILSGTSTGSARYWAQIDIVNGTPSVATSGKLHGVDFTISAAFSGKTLVFTLSSTYAKALIKTTVSQSTSSGLDTFTWA